MNWRLGTNDKFDLGCLPMAARLSGYRSFTTNESGLDRPGLDRPVMVRLGRTLHRNTWSANEGEAAVLLRPSYGKFSTKVDISGLPNPSYQEDTHRAEAPPTPLQWSMV